MMKLYDNKLDSMTQRGERWIQTLREMLIDRQYSDFEEDIDNILINKTTVCKNRDGQLLLLGYLDQSQVSGNVGKNDVKAIMDENMKPQNINHAILILDRVTLTPSAKTDILNMFPEIIVESFSVNDLLINITRHEKVPKHILLSEAEMQEILVKYKATKDKMPKIAFHDPVARYLGMLPGDMCKIERRSETAGKTPFYRVCEKI